MTSLGEAKEAVLQAWRDGWASNDIPYVLDNEAFEAGAPPRWLRLSIRGVEGAQETLGAVGSRRFLRRAKLYVQVFTEANRGTQAGDQIAEQVRGIFEGKRVGPVWFKHADIEDVGNTERWFQQNIAAEFCYEGVA